MSGKKQKEPGEVLLEALDGEKGSCAWQETKKKLKFQSSWLKTLTCPEKKGGVLLKLLNPARDSAQHPRMGFIFVFTTHFFGINVVPAPVFWVFLGGMGYKQCWAGNYLGILGTSGMFWARLDWVWINLGQWQVCLSMAGGGMR